MCLIRSHRTIGEFLSMYALLHFLCLCNLLLLSVFASAPPLFLSLFITLFLSSFLSLSLFLLSFSNPFALSFFLSPDSVGHSSRSSSSSLFSTRSLVDSLSSPLLVLLGFIFHLSPMLTKHISHKLSIPQCSPPYSDTQQYQYSYG